ncbi:MAG: hypothetical protein K2P58_04340 [Hyphomonadaceae bacterium]|nr:hypothetical protein [Hyphomonadaceae bacterium]
MSIAASASGTAPHKMHWTTKLGVAAVVLFMLVVAGLNAIGWINTLPGPAGIAAAFVAISLEAMAFVLWEHLVAYHKARDYGRFMLSLLGLIFAVSINVEGGHRGLEHMAAPFYVQAEADRRTAQEALDAERASITEQVASLQTRVDAFAATNPGLTLSGRMEQWRENFDIVTSEDRRQIAALRARLDQLPLVAAAPEPYPKWAPYALAAAFAFFSVFGLTMFGVKVPGPELQVAGRNAVAARQMASAMRAKQLDTIEQTEPPAILEKAEELPPLDEDQIRRAIAALALQEKPITAVNVARFYKVKVARVYGSPGVIHLQDYIERERVRKGMKTAADAIAAPDGVDGKQAA